MIIDEEFLSRLRLYFSLNLYEVKIWTALLSKGVATAGELSELAGVPRSRAYDILESLEKKGFVVMKFGKPIKYMALPPEEVVERVKKNLKKETEEKIKRLNELNNTEILEELNALHTQGVELIDPTDYSGSLRGRHNIYNHFELIMKSAEKELILMTTTDGFKRKVEEFKPIFEKLKKRNVKIRIATQLDDSCKPYYELIKDLAEVRHIPKSAARFMIVDGNELIFMLMHDKDVHPSYDIGIWVNTPFFASALAEMFDLAWKEMIPAEKKIETKK